MPHHVIAFFLMPSINLVVGRLALIKNRFRTSTHGYHADENIHMPPQLH